MRRALTIILVTALVVALAAAILLPLLLDKQKILELASARIHEQTGATLRVGGDVEISIFPRLGLALEQAALDMPDPGQPSLRARSLEIGVQLLPLLSKQLVIDSVLLDGVVVKMTTQPAPPPLDTTQLSDAQLQDFYRKRREQIEQAGRAAGAGAVLAVPLALNVGKLRIADSRLETTEVDSTATRVVEIVDLRAGDLNLDGRPMTLEAALRIPGEPPLELNLQGRFTLDQASQMLGIEALEATVRGALAADIALHASGQVDINRRIADLGISAAIADTRAEGKLRYASFESPQIDTRLHLNHFTPALLAVAGPQTAAQAQTGEASEGGDIPLPLDALRAMDTRAELNIDEVVFAGHRLSNLQTLLRVADGYAALPRLTGELHGGQLSVKASLNAKHSIARVGTQGGLTGMDIAEALAASGVRPLLSGKASLNWNLHGEGNSSDAITGTLRGPIELTTADAVLTGTSVEQALCRAVALVNQERLSTSFPADSPFQQLAAQITLGAGKATLTSLNAAFPDLGLHGTGALDLASLDFKAKFDATLSASLAERDPACRVDERLTAINWPVRCKGNAAGEPGDWCAVDSSAIVEDLTKYELKHQALKKLKRELGEEGEGPLKKLFGK